MFDIYEWPFSDESPHQNEDMEHDSIAQDWEIEQPMNPR